MVWENSQPFGIQILPLRQKMILALGIALKYTKKDINRKRENEKMWQNLDIHGIWVTEFIVLYSLFHICLFFTIKLFKEI